MKLRPGWIILCGIVGFAAARYGRPASDAIQGAIQSKWKELKEQQFEFDTTRSLTFELRKDQWTTFKIPQLAVRLRVLTNAALFETPDPHVFEGVKRPGWRYSIDYQLLGKSGNVVHESEYHFRANIAQYRDVETGEVFSPSFFQNKPSIPINTRTLFLALDQYEEPIDAIRVRLANHEPAISDVVVRVLNQQLRHGYDKSFTWTRLSTRNRERLSRSNVYTEDLLTDVERTNFAPMAVGADGST